MIVNLKSSIKMIGVTVMAFCAVFVCNLFLNYNIDLAAIEGELSEPYQVVMYDAMMMTGKVVSALSGGCLLITSGVMLFFYIKQYINSHSKELGILKALGYPNFKTAKGFWVFGLNILTGTAAGYGCSFLLMPAFYEKQNADKVFPDFGVSFHPSLFFLLVILPAAGFAALAVIFALMKLKKPVLSLLKEIPDTKIKKIGGDNVKVRNGKEVSFITELKRATLKSKKTLVFFIAFAAFCFSAMMQMSLSMDELASEMFAYMIMAIGLVLAFTSLFLGVSTVIGTNRKTIAMMKVEGYSVRLCGKAVLSGYRPVAYIGFALGTVYQYVLLKIMVEVVFADFENVPSYEFDFKGFVVCLAAFVLFYEVMMRYCSGKIRKCSVKEVMEGE